MGKRIIRVILSIVILLLLFSGSYLIYQILAPEIEYKIDKPNEKEIIETIQSEAVLNTNKLFIPAIGVDVEIGKDKTFLDYNGWIQESEPEGFPEVIAIHRFGLNSLTPEQKIKQTLYHIGKLKQGDLVYIVWEGQLYEYKIKDITEGVNNPEIKSDLVIYTCKFINSNNRVFIVLTKQNL